MAKSARASKIKTNNSKLKSRVFGPVETARTERLSAKLLELASQPRPNKNNIDDVAMDVEGGICRLQFLELSWSNLLAESKEGITDVGVKDVKEADCKVLWISPNIYQC